MDERYFILVYHNGEITNIEEEVTFCSQNPVGVSVSPSVTLLELQNTILRKLGQLNNKQINQVLYMLPIVFGQSVVCYRSFSVRSDDDVSLMFYGHSQFPKIRIIELFIILEDTNVSSGGLAPNPPSYGMNFSARGSDPNPLAYQTSLPMPSLTFALCNLS